MQKKTKESNPESACLNSGVFAAQPTKNEIIVTYLKNIFKCLKVYLCKETKLLLVV